MCIPEHTYANKHTHNAMHNYICTDTYALTYTQRCTAADTYTCMHTKSRFVTYCALWNDFKTPRTLFSDLFIRKHIV